MSDKNEKTGISESPASAEKGYVNIQSTGAVQVSANSAVAIEGESVLISTPGYLREDVSNTDIAGSIIMNNTQKIVLQAETSITLAVGNNAIVINHDGITLNAGSVFSTAGPMSCLLNMNAFSGAVLAAPKCVISGTMGNTFADGMGNTMNFGPSGINLSGLSVSLSETLKSAAISTAILSAIKLISQITTTIIASTQGPQSVAGKKAAAANTQITQLLSLIGPIMAFSQKQSEYYNGACNSSIPAYVDRCRIASQILNLISSILNAIALSVNTWDPAWSQKYINDSKTLTNQDCFRICAMVSSFAACCCVLVPTYLGMKKKFSQVRLHDGVLEKMVKKEKTVANTTSQTNSLDPLDGSKNTTVEENQNIEQSQGNLIENEKIKNLLK